MRIFTFALLLAAMTAPLSAQDNPHATHGTHGDHGTMSGPTKGGMPAEPGQSAFAAIQEIVALLEGDPATDWSKVDVEALRQHLIDMNNVTLAATVASEPMAGGIRYQISGQGAVVQSIQRMVVAPARMMDGANGIAMSAQNNRAGAVLLVIAAPEHLPKLRALGFIGLMTSGMHHQSHHWMIATGADPHP